MATKTKTVESDKQEAARREQLLRNIAELGGKGMKEEDIVFEGTKLRLPERWTGNLGAAISYLETKQEEEEEKSNFSRSFKYRPWDGAYNAFQAMRKAFGMVAGKTTYTFFGPNRPAYISVPISETETEEVPWGQFTVPLLNNTTFIFGTDRHADYGMVFKITIESPRKNRFVIEGLFKLIEEELEANSIYRGKAIDGQDNPQFLDLRGFKPEQVVYAEQVFQDLEANLWSVLKYSQANRDLGLPLKRSILLTGPYGTGKTLAGLKTAVETRETGWTFIMARPGRDNFTQVMETARLYQPAVVFMEDVDTIATAENEDYISQLLDLFDGIQSKNTDLMVVLTTNHPDNIHKGMLRPGRVDAVIEIGALDPAGIEKLIRAQIGNDRLDADIDFVEIAEACKDYAPAFLVEVARRGIRYALARNNGDLNGHKLSTSDLVYAAGGLRPQYERMTGAREKSERLPLDTMLAGLIKDGTRTGIASVIRTDEREVEYNSDVWNLDEVVSVQRNGKG